MTKYYTPTKTRIRLLNWANHIASLTTKEALVQLAKFPEKELHNFINKTPVLT